tara:strand:+ start:235 stop:510 length:276 start_codon:yes stop_codon:yes gene_type:complete
LVFSATVDSGIIIWDDITGLTGPPMDLFKLLLLLDGSDISPFGPGPTLKLNENNPYAVVWAINQIQPEALLAGDVPNFEDILGPIDPDGIY